MEGPAPQKRRRAPRKTDAERGPLGAWAYHAMDDLGLSDQQIADRAEVSTGTIRKIMGGSEREPSARVLRAMHRYFQEIGTEQGVPVDKPPGLDLMATSPNGTTQTGEVAALISQMAAQTDAINRLIDRLDSLASAAIRDGVADALREVGLYPDDGASRAELPPGPQG